MLVLARCVLGFVSGVAFACAPVRSSLRPAATPRPSGSAPQRFEFGHADSARKAKLLAVVPRLDALFASKLKETRATGAAVGIVVDGELVYARGFGVKDVESARPVDLDTVFRIGSLTKGFTALSIMKLRDAGRVALDVPAATYLPELATLVPPTRDSPPITLRLLLTNASGLAYDDLWGAVTFGKTWDELAGMLRAGVQLSTTPGTQYAYSNLGWALLGRTVENVTQRSYREYVTSEILRPLGMSSTVWEAGDVSAERLAIGYRNAGERLVPEPLPSDGAFASAGGLYTSLRDFSRYIAYQLGAYPPRDDPEVGPVKRSTLREMHEGQRWARGFDKDVPVARSTDDGLVLGAASYGFGWLNVTSCTEEGRVQHGGFEPGYYGWVVLMPRARVGFVTLATTGPVGIAARSAVFDILREAGLMTPPAARLHPGLAAVPDALLRLLAGWDAELAERLFDPDSAKYSWEPAREDFERLRRDHGTCRPDGEPSVYAPLHAEFRFACERGALRFDVLLSPAVPVRLQHTEITEELAPDEATVKAAQRLAAAIGRSDLADSGLFVDPVRAKRTLRRLESAGGCTIERGWVEVTRAPWSINRRTRYLLRCSDGPLELDFGVDAESGRVAGFAAHRPRSFDATCWQ